MSIVYTGVFVAVMLLVARWITQWVANRPDSYKPPPRSDQPPDKAAMLQDQVSSKILWDAPDHEVLEWLEEKHQITGDRAAAMLARAKSERARTIREKALYGVLFTGVGTVATGAMVAVQFSGGIIFVRGTIILTAAFIIFAFWFGKHLHRLLAGQTDSSAGL